MNNIDDFIYKCPLCRNKDLIDKNSGRDKKKTVLNKNISNFLIYSDLYNNIDNPKFKKKEDLKNGKSEIIYQKNESFLRHKRRSTSSNDIFEYTGNYYCI
jgi:hypothetical protein